MTPPLPNDGEPAVAARTHARFADWIVGCRFTPSGGLVADAAGDVDPMRVFEACRELPHVLFLDSALPDDAVLDERGAAAPRPGVGDVSPRLGRFSFVAADPLHSLRVEAVGDPAALADCSARLRGLLADLATPTIPGLPPFQGGVAGMISYDFGLARLGIPAPTTMLAPTPVLSLHVYDVVFAFDHLQGRGWFISQGLPVRGIAARRRRSEERLARWLEQLAGAPVPPPPRPLDARLDTRPGSFTGHPLPAQPAVRATHTPDRYRAMVAAGIEFVRAGDIFQVNLAQQFVVDAAVDARALAAACRTVNPAPFAGALDMGDAWIVSMSPERFLQVRGRAVRMHPIKGTRRRIASPEADLYAGEDLEASGKDRAENVMIVDLVRNDLARVCTPQSVRVEALCRLERYRYVQHLVSVVSGRLRPGLGALDVFEAAIPAGSVTGAPKLRACEIIADLEGVARGAYCGSLGYIGFDGAADFNLLIRTFVVGPGRITFAAGGGITAASDPAAEYAESLHKAEGLLRVLAAVGVTDGRRAT